MGFIRMVLGDVSCFDGEEGVYGMVDYMYLSVATLTYILMQ